MVRHPFQCGCEYTLVGTKSDSDSEYDSESGNYELLTQASDGRIASST
jgi:hypothetical protein